MEVLKSKAEEDEEKGERRRRSILHLVMESSKKRKRRKGVEGSPLFSCPRLTRMMTFPIYY
jgi:hypothetical protein